MDNLESVLKSIKNPFYLNTVLTNNDLKLFNDPNSYLWNNLLIHHYRSLHQFKIQTLSIKDYYILVYLAEILGIFDLKIINKSQLLLNILPKIYDGDIICILNACCNTASLSGHYKIHLFRKQDINNDARVFGKGLLKYQFIHADKDIYSEEKINTPNDSQISLLNGCYNPNDLFSL
jgi:hypothetical protein